MLQCPSVSGCSFQVAHGGFSWTEFLFLLLLKLLYDSDLNFAGSDARKKRESEQEPLFCWWCPSMRHQPWEGWWGMCNGLVRWGLAAKKEKLQKVLSCPIGRKKGVWDSVRALPGSSSPSCAHVCGISISTVCLPTLPPLSPRLVSRQCPRHRSRKLWNLNNLCVHTDWAGQKPILNLFSDSKLFDRYLHILKASNWPSCFFFCLTFYIAHLL